MQRLAPLPKPPGFALGLSAIRNWEATAESPPRALGTSPPNSPLPQRMPSRFGAANSDLAFSGTYLFVGNMMASNFMTSPIPRRSALCRGSRRWKWASNFVVSRPISINSLATTLFQPNNSTQLMRRAGTRADSTGFRQNNCQCSD
jgi:hypothetical protein